MECQNSNNTGFVQEGQSEIESPPLGTDYCSTDVVEEVTCRWVA